MRTIRNPIAKKEDGLIKVRIIAMNQGTPKIKLCTIRVTFDVLHTFNKSLKQRFLPMNRKMIKVEIDAKRSDFAHPLFINGSG